MGQYNINDPDSIKTMEFDFECISGEEWEEYIAFCKTDEYQKSYSFKDVSLLKQGARFSGRPNKLSPKQLISILSIVERIDRLKEDNEKDTKAAELYDDEEFELPPSHLTLRVAWHDNKWNGSICNDPVNNIYCSGFHSLLSERIRKRKNENIDKEIVNSGKPVNEIDYLPPCFWSINLFGKEQIKVRHDNPAAPNLETIEEDVPKQSVISWPFAVSFTRTKQEQSESGAYPKNLESVRIPRFNAKVQEGKSIGFVYTKFSNPLTEEEQQYLVVGAGVIDNKQKASQIPHFGPKAEIEKIKSRPRSNYKYRNFPSMNWAMRFSFDDYSMVRMPYHEYLEEAERLDDEAKDKFLNKIKVAISEPELEWCFKYVAMDIGDDEAIYILTKMRKALIDCKNDGIVPKDSMQKRIKMVDDLLGMAWESRTYFPGFISLSRVILNQVNEPSFKWRLFMRI